MPAGTVNMELDVPSPLSDTLVAAAELPTGFLIGLPETKM